MLTSLLAWDYIMLESAASVAQEEMSEPKQTLSSGLNYASDVETTKMLLTFGFQRSFRIVGYEGQIIFTSRLQIARVFFCPSNLVIQHR